MGSSEVPRASWVFFGNLILVAFLLNWPWEMLQMPGYREMAHQNWRSTGMRCAIASVGDVVMTLAAYGLGALAAGRWDWGIGVHWQVLAASSLLGAMFGGAFELWALLHKRWSYTDKMPLVPVLDIGLWPGIQLAVLIPLSISVASWASSRAGRDD